jgi:hypothetical protein
VNITQIELESTKQLVFRGKEIATIERRDCDDRTDCLDIRFASGRGLTLSSAVDISEQLDCPRIFVIEGTRDDLLVLFGGKTAYWLTIDGRIKEQSSLFRRWSEAEYWTTEVVNYKDELILIYEAGVMVINDLLQITLHRRKLLNDFFAGLDGQMLKFRRDHDDEWLMPLAKETDSPGSHKF